MKLFKKKKVINLVIEDYIIRMIEDDGLGEPYSVAVKELYIPKGYIEEGQIVDDPGFYEFMKTAVAKWGIKNRAVRFFVPEASVLMKPVSYPSSLKQDQIKEHFIMEIGQSIHLPFEDPIIDVVKISQDAPKERSAKEELQAQGILFAVPSEEVRKFTEIFEDCHLKPLSADIRMLSNFRLIDFLQMIKPKETYLLCEWSLNSLTVAIFSDKVLDFMRYQMIETSLDNWTYEEGPNGLLEFKIVNDSYRYEEQLQDQMNELERIMNFYRFSLHKGDKSVDQIMFMGDTPYLPAIIEQVENLYSVPVTHVSSNELKRIHSDLDSRHVSLAGLMVKEAVS